MSVTITYITNGNKSEERLVNIMGRTVIETESEKLIRRGREAGRAEGRMEGIEAGRAEGREAGRAEGREAGRAEGKAEEIIEMGQEFGLDDAAILKRLQERIGLSLETAAAYLEQYGKQLM